MFVVMLALMLPPAGVYFTAFDMRFMMFVYCHSGARSGRATSVLREMGYTNVNNIGGIAGYTGRVAR